MNSKAAIEELYQAFANISKPLEISACPCCTAITYSAELKQLASQDVKHADPNILENFENSWLNTIGTKIDVMYYLPRMFECKLTPAMDYVAIGNEVFVPLLSKAGFDQWTERQ